MTVLDRASGTTWDSIAPNPAASVSHVVLKEKTSLESGIDIDGVSLHLDLSLDGVEPAFNLTLSAPVETPLKGNVSYPFPLRAPASSYRMVLPHKTGLLFTVQDAATNRKFTGQYPCYGSGLSMPWVGVTDLTRGLMTIIETPEECGCDAADRGRQVFAPQVYWQPSRGTLGYARKLHYRLFEQRWLRGHVQVLPRPPDPGRPVRHLAREAEIPPSIEQADRSGGSAPEGERIDDQMEAVKQLESKGVKRMLINSGASRETLAWMRERGYLTGSYRIYSDIRSETSRGYPQDAYTEKDGKPTHGFGYSETHKSTYRCSLLQLPLMKEQIPPLIREKGYEAIFLDVVTCGSAARVLQPGASAGSPPGPEGQDRPPQVHHRPRPGGGFGRRLRLGRTLLGLLRRDGDAAAVRLHSRGDD